MKNQNLFTSIDIFQLLEKWHPGPSIQYIRIFRNTRCNNPYIMDTKVEYFFFLKFQQLGTRNSENK